MVSQSELRGIILPIGSCLGPKYGFYRYLPRDPPGCTPLGWRIWFYLTLSGISIRLLGIGNPCNPPSWARKVLIGHQNRVPRLVPQQFFCLEVRVPGWDPRKEDHPGIHGVHPPHCRSLTGKLAEASRYLNCPSSCPPCLQPRHHGAGGSTTTSAVE